MKYPSIHIEGAILASDILEKIEQGELTGQKPIDFKLDGSFKVKDEIARAWADARDYWRIFKRKREAIASNERLTGTSETRNQWMIPFLGILGYKAEFARAEEVNGKSFAISHRDKSLDNLPLHIMGFKDSLDKKRADGGPRMSPHALVQEYLNLTEHLYAIVTNGLQIRLLRDSSRLVKLSYIEFDLEQIMEEEQYADFAILFRLLHYTRMPVNQDTVAESLLEVYHQNSLESGSRIREGLSDAVKKSIIAFANGFLSHPKNEALRQWFEEGNHEDKETRFFQWQLRLIYRLLFLMVIEERDLIFPKEANKKLKNYYYEFYSINKLRRLSEKRHLADARYSDYWQSIRNTFRLFEKEKYGKALGIAPLSGLFDYQQIDLLNESTLDNKVMMKCLRNLSVFKNKNNNQMMRVNYASLNVEEFGSVYEGLLEYKAVVAQRMGKPHFDLMKGSDRSSSGSHYTPDELVQPLIKHSLDYIIEDRLKNPEKFAGAVATSPLKGGMRGVQEAALLSITVCDVACGSGHILLNAARRIATELTIVRTGEEQPSPSEMRLAIRDVIRHCIYGVDLNPLAVELCKVALWLEAHNPNEPLNFLDHHIKCGNAIVGLAHRDELENGIANEAFKTLPGDDKEIAKALLVRNRNESNERKDQGTQINADFEETTAANVQEAMVEYKVFRKMPETSPDDIAAKQKAYNKFLDGKGYTFLKIMCDTQVAQFFISKTEENKGRFVTDNDFRQMMQGYRGWQSPHTAKATAIALEKRFFHWFLEFPEVFSNEGFDCILGNPPYLGGKRISGFYGDSFLNYVKVYFQPASGSVDLISYFVRRYFNIVKGFFSFISTNSISQGDTKASSLDVLCSNGVEIVFAYKNIPWPGLAAVDVTLISCFKGKFIRQKYLKGHPVNYISTLLDNDAEFYPYRLVANKNKSFQGSIIFGDGFLLTETEANQFLTLNNMNTECIFPYLIGDNINSRPNQDNSRWVINFFNWSESDASKYSDLYERVREKVKPLRDKVKRKVYREKWWQFAEKGVNLYDAIKSNNRVLVIPQTTKYLGFSFVQPNQVYAGTLIVFSNQTMEHYMVMQSSIHEVWAWKSATTMGSSTIRYVNSSYYETFPFPLINNQFKFDEPNFHDSRKQFMLNNDIGLTEFYNCFHASQIQPSVTTIELNGKTNKENEKQYGKEVWNLWNHLQKNKGACSWEEVVEGIVVLRQLHKQLDEAVLEAYGWHEDSEKWGPAIKLRHDFYEVDYLPENDRVRYTIHPEARKEVLKRLLLLNHERYEEEIKQGLHKKKDVISFYKQKNKEVPPGTIFNDAKGKGRVKKQKKTASKVEEPKEGYGTLFD
jgi:type I restriction-modification system DNA methylase subunit